LKPEVKLQTGSSIFSNGELIEQFLKARYEKLPL